MRASYPTYKSTSIPWLPEMPEHWDALKAKHIFKERSEKGYPDEPLLAATQTKGVVRKEEYETRTVTAQKDFHLLKLVKEEDFVISLRSFQGGIEYAYHRGIISPAYTIFYERNKVPVNKAFYRHLFKSHPFINSLTLFVTGIREGQNIDYAEFKDSLLPFPPLTEQTAIANYLDAKAEQINRFIEKKQKLIALLKEQKRSLTTEIIQEEAKNVEKIKLKYCVRNVSVQTSQMAKDDIYLGMENVESWTGLYVESEQKDFESQAKMFQFNDVLFGKLRPYLAKVFLANIKGVCSGEFLVLRPSKKIAPEYLQLVLLDPEFISLVNSSTFGAKMPRADWGFIGNQLISIPSIAQQKQIVAMIKSEGETIDKVIGRIEKEIEKVKELKQSLIAEAVTGKIKVA
jgi:type I restriction enzyme, S subunit